MLAPPFDCAIVKQLAVIWFLWSGRVKSSEIYRRMLAHYKENLLCKGRCISEWKGSIVSEQVLLMNVRFEVLMVVETEFVVFWVVALYSVVVGYQHSVGLYCLYLQGSMALWNVGIQPPHYTVQQPRKTQNLSLLKTAQDVWPLHKWWISFGIISLVQEVGWITVTLMADKLDIGCGYLYSIIHEDLGYHKICARLVPKMLTDGHKQTQMEMCMQFLQWYHEEREAFLQQIFTGSETWVHHNESANKYQGME